MTDAGDGADSTSAAGQGGALVPAGVDPRLHDVVEHNAYWFPDRPALIYESTLLTWEGFRDRLVSLAGGLERSGVADGDRIAVLASNAVDYVVLQYALSLVGAILVPVNTRLAVPEIAYILRDCEPVLLLHDGEHAGKAAAAARDAGVPARVEALDSAPAAPGLWAWTEGALAAGDTAPAGAGRTDTWDRPHAILYTGGTTGRPKGAVITHRRNLVDGISVGSALGLRGHERFLCLAPLSHTAAWDYLKIYFLVGGSAVVLPRFDGATVVRALDACRCNGLWTVPLMLHEIMACEEFRTADLSAVRLIAYSAFDPTQLMPAVIEAFRSRGAASVQIAHGYGLTEAGPFVTVLRPEEAEDDPSSVGTPVPGVRVALFDDDGRPVGRGEIGEVCVRSAAVMAGYWRQPEETAAAFRGGWLRTGDLGRINELDHLEIVDRRKDMIRTAGENVYAKEVELTLLEHPAVTDCAVIGRRDERYDERVVAIVVGDVGDDELRAFARERLAGFKVPREFIRLDALPKTAAGKTAKAELRASYP